MKDAPCTASEAVVRAQSLVERGGQYILGTGDYRPFTTAELGEDFKDLVKHTVDVPWTLKNGKQGSDCAGFAVCWCWKVQRGRPGFNRGSWATVEDDINVNSIMEDAVHKRELAQGVVSGRASGPKPGDLLCYPSFTSRGKKLIGHVALVEKVGPRFSQGRYDLLTVIQCHGPNGFRPGVVRTDGSLFMHHDSVWPLPQHRTQIVRMKERA